MLIAYEGFNAMSWILYNTIGFHLHRIQQAHWPCGFTSGVFFLSFINQLFNDLLFTAVEEGYVILFIYIIILVTPLSSGHNLIGVKSNSLYATIHYSKTKLCVSIKHVIFWPQILLITIFAAGDLGKISLVCDNLNRNQFLWPKMLHLRLSETLI